MENKRSWLFLALLALLTAAAVSIVCIETSRGAAPRREAFERLVGGLGLGSDLGGSPCLFSLDPRLEAGCEQDVWPVPGGQAFCRHPGSSVRLNAGVMDRDRNARDEDASMD